LLLPSFLSFLAGSLTLLMRIWAAQNKKLGHKVVARRSLEKELG
jgi:hypothetical protein